ARQSTFVKTPLFLRNLINACEPQSTATPRQLPVSHRNADQNSAVPQYRTFQDTSALFVHHAPPVPRPARHASCNRQQPATLEMKYEIAPVPGAQAGATFATTCDHSRPSILQLRNSPHAKVAW